MVLLKLEYIHQSFGNLVKMQISIQKIWMGLGFCISNKLSGDMGAADQQTMLLSSKGLLSILL